jgi:hypothetical protein
MMRRSTGLALVAIGAILSLAMRVPLAFLHLKLTGLVLMIIGLAGLGVPQRVYHWLRAHQERLRAHQEQLTGALCRFMEPPLPPGPRVPLDDLLRPEAAAGTVAGSVAGRR